MALKNLPMKILFLDWDGVANKRGTPVLMVGDILTMADPELVYRLNLIVDRTECELVLSSSWRHAPDWREAMKASGIVKPLLDRTPRYSSCTKYGITEDELCRGHNIQDWLDDHPEVEKYAILDDSSDMLASQMPNFFKTETEDGLTQEIADAVEKHLS